jgi:hypothetical protein
MSWGMQPSSPLAIAVAFLIKTQASTYVDKGLMPLIGKFSTAR